MLGNALKMASRHDEAEQEFTRLLDHFSEDKRFIPMIDLGRLHAARSEFERAAEWFKKAIEAEPRKASAYNLWGSS